MNEHLTEISVRDYECDMQGVVNNACYLHYLEHGRHCMLRDYGIDFAQLTAEEIFPVVTHIDLHYLKPASSGDALLVKTSVEQKDRVRIIFYQQIISSKTERLLIDARVTAVVLTGTKRVPLKIQQSTFTALLSNNSSPPQTPR